MSAVAAIFDFADRPVLPAELEVLSSAIEHRGIDGTEQKLEASFGMAHAALHTNVEAGESVQPLSSACGNFVLIMDGFVSNWKELRSQLLAKGAVLRDRSDAELVLHAFLVWGPECPRFVDGEYALAIWDGVKKQAFVARDHHGLRPLYFHLDAGRLALCSEIKPLLDLMATRAPLNRGYLAEIMGGELFSNNETAWQGIERLPAANAMIVNADGRKRATFWSVPDAVTIRYASTAEYIEHYRAVLTDSVCRASRTNRPIGAELSGGLDSSATYCLAHKLLGEGFLSAPSIFGYTCTSPQGSLADELDYAREAAIFADGSLCEVPLFQPGLDWFSQAAQQSANIPNYTNGADSRDLERAMQRDGCRIALNGIGGDQWLDGSELFIYDSVRSGDWRGLISGVRADVDYRGGFSGLTFALRQALVACLPDGLRRAYHRQRANRKGRAGPFWLSQQMQAELSERREKHESNQPNSRMLRIKRAKHSNAQFQLSIELMEQQRAASNIEGRSPMLSRAFIEFSARTPEHIRYRGGFTKFVHREAIRGIVPETIIKRQDKAAFPETDNQRADLLEFLKNALGNQRLLSLCDEPGLRQLIDHYSDDSESIYWATEAWMGYCGLVLMQQFE